ncbi:hypothetical protein GGD81_002682 [Rhodobium orientis]|uniref:CENP-V/GFA domain-containing protein n=1 Tax=Rhodobium orientis TaxID=34017 RepID=A0A327JJY9_9HYPH|nr:GFA family protein [Rhodobium orientis]MBB4303635.1 hypothetical protein [Rhodobium orientis]MBK5951909.1 hypothetical protein [Rhodobium orientis]RAI26760.1 hypothetical protein CH339_12740 [Rhodobium orientis]
MADADDSKATGGCQCGHVRYELTAPPTDLYVCHCRECRAQSASAFGISVIVDGGDIRLVSGTPSVWTREATVGGTLDCHFCPHCGTRLFHGTLAPGETVSVKGGSLDVPPDLSGAKHIWTSRKLPGVVIPDHVETWPEEPE